VEIPLLGYHWLDFDLNTDEDSLQAMWDRAWHATVNVLGRPQASPVSTATVPLITGVDAADTPYNPPSARSATDGS
jgi:hypothetical protein